MSELDVVNFTNIDREPFEGKWGGEVNIIKAGETKQFPKFLAEHYCKHLVNKILIRGGRDWTSADLRKPLEDRVLGKVAVETDEEEKKEEEITFEEAPKEEKKEEVKTEEAPKPKRKPRKRAVKKPVE